MMPFPPLPHGEAFPTISSKQSNNHRCPSAEQCGSVGAQGKLVYASGTIVKQAFCPYFQHFRSGIEPVRKKFEIPEACEVTPVGRPLCVSGDEIAMRGHCLSGIFHTAQAM